MNSVKPQGFERIVTVMIDGQERQVKIDKSDTAEMIMRKIEKAFGLEERK